MRLLHTSDWHLGRNFHGSSLLREQAAALAKIVELAKENCVDAVLIDEGFGTLDPDNLQLAMDELDRLREGGRMIGIISHVGGLRERVRSGIEVLASDEGSRVVVRSSAMP